MGSAASDSSAMTGSPGGGASSKLAQLPQMFEALKNQDPNVQLEATIAFRKLLDRTLAADRSGD